MRNGKLLNDVTLLLSADKSTDGNGVGVSECERSCTAREKFDELIVSCPRPIVDEPPPPLVCDDVVENVTEPALLLEPILLCEDGDGEGLTDE